MGVEGLRLRRRASTACSDRRSVSPKSAYFRSCSHVQSSCMTNWLNELGNDVIFAIRQLRNSPAFAVVSEQLVSIRSITALEDIAWAATGRHRFRAVMVVAFAALALAMVGVFGILAYSVQ